MARISRKEIGDLTITNSVNMQAGKGTKGSGVTMTSVGDSRHMRTLITIPSTVTKSITAATSACVNHKIFTFPAGDIIVNAVRMSVNPPTGGAAPTGANTMDVGLGGVAATGANIALSVEGATTENILTGQTITPSATAAVAVVSGGGCATAIGGASDARVVIPASAAHTVYLNAAMLAPATGTVAFPGTVTLDWTKMS